MNEECSGLDTPLIYTRIHFTSLPCSSQRRSKN
uniref:Uncharacterized protein n=1 Tax=Anguilla anguilla TaxID=7936 RepID=A0A0E9T8Z4_ANGAN